MHGHDKQKHVNSIMASNKKVMLGIKPIIHHPMLPT